MFNQQSFHTANYKGNTQGHDSNLRSDSQNPSSSYGTGSSFGIAGSNISQYRGTNKAFQPAGFVQSAYGQNQNAAQLSKFQSPQSFHAASYRGNQAGHDQYLRADATSPSQSGWSSSNQAGSSFGTGPQFGISYQGQGQAQSQSQSQYQNPQSFHAASYRGNQAGHDQYLRADATSPSQSGLSSSNQAGSSFGTGPQFGISNQGQSQSQSQYQNPQSFHAASYRGNQAGHDQSLRADATNPSQSQYNTSKF